MSRFGKGSPDGGGPIDGPGQRKSVTLLLERFPHVQAVSLHLLQRSEDFRDLCDEYAACSSACDRLEHRDSEHALRQEYAALRLRLEGELLRYIEHQTGPPLSLRPPDTDQEP
jgi:hypothetical protein